MKSYIISAFVFLGFDIVWLSLASKSFYPQYIGHLMTADVNYLAAVLFYLIYIFGLNYFVLWPHLATPAATVGKKPAWFQGAALGFLCYATYDFTNWATLKDFPFLVVAVDCLWGTFATGMCAGLTAKILSKSVRAPVSA